MLIDVRTFQSRVEHDLWGLVAALQNETGRKGESEAMAWERSLPALASILDHEALKEFHLHLGKAGNVSLEYRLPASSSWADAVLLGRGLSGPAAVVVELKDWDTSADRPGPRSGLVLHKGVLTLHPSEQVRGYVEYCRRYHSAVHDNSARVTGCVFFSSAMSAEVYSAEPHTELATEYPIFTRRRPDIADRFPAFLGKQLAEPDPEFAHAFEHGSYQQDRSFVRQVAKAIADPETSPFVLLDEQRAGFEKCMKHIDQVMAATDPERKSVIIVEGPPGSGKSVLAAHLWATLAGDDRLRGNVVLTTTSSSQRTNWEHLFERTAGTRAAAGIVVGANRYNPGLSPIWVKRERTRGRSVAVSEWKENLKHYLGSGERNRCPDDTFTVSIVDEAHALIDPTLPGKEGVPPSGWTMHAGPQAWHVMRASRVSVFLMDGDQSYRDNETTSRTRIEELAADLGIAQVEVISLAGAQFRCGGSTEYMSWLDALLDLGDGSPVDTLWRHTEGGPFVFEIVDDPGALDERLRAKTDEGASVRLVASYARPWKTNPKKVADPHSLPAAARDFNIPYRRNGSARTWSRIWNFAPAQDYTQFIQAPEGSAMASDPLCEVGCPYVVRGFDYDYLGVLWLSDLVWRDGWEANLDQIHESAWKKTKSQAQKERGSGPATDELVKRLQRGYRILLSRAIRGAFVWFEDERTRAYVQSYLIRNK